MPRKPRTRTVTARRTVAEEVTVTETTPDTDTQPVVWAAGFARGFGQPAEHWNAQRATQRDQALGLLVMYAQSAPPDDPVPEWLTRQAVNILRALPGATPLELTLGRST